MVKLVVAYGQPVEPAALDEYYASTHAPLVQKIPVCAVLRPGRCSRRRTGPLLPSTSSRSCGLTTRRTYRPGGAARRGKLPPRMSRPSPLVAQH